jgi:hypothetical protein
MEGILSEVEGILSLSKDAAPSWRTARFDKLSAPDNTTRCGVSP